MGVTYDVEEEMCHDELMVFDTKSSEMSLSRRRLDGHADEDTVMSRTFMFITSREMMTFFRSTHTIGH